MPDTIDARRMKPGKAALAGWLVLAALFAATASPAQQHAPLPKSQAQAASEEEAPAPPKKPGEEPVRIHGHWVLDVKDAQGRVVRHRDFENSLKQTGTDILTLLLTGRATSAGFAVRAIQSTAGAMQTYQISPDYLVRPTFPCPIGSTYAPNLVYCVKGLQQSVVLPAGCAIASCTGGTNILLQGQFTASAPIMVDTLTTYPLVCKNLGDLGPHSVAASTCASNSGSVSGYETPYDFTGTTIAPLSVDTGQTLAITVTLSFS